jgi:hypothetical protein
LAGRRGLADAHGEPPQLLLLEPCAIECAGDEARVEALGRVLDHGHHPSREELIGDARDPVRRRLRRSLEWERP